MKKEIKIIKMPDTACVACGLYETVGLGSMILDTKGMTKSLVEQVFVTRFNSQIVDKRKKGGAPFAKGRTGWTIKWYEYSDISKSEKQEVLGLVANTVAKSGKPKIYMIEKKLDGSLKVNKIEGKLYDEDELKLALFEMAVNGEK